MVSSAASTVGLNGTWSQPVGVKLALSPLSVTVAGAHDVGSVMKSLSSVSCIELTGRPPVCSCAIVESSPPSGRRLIDASFLTSHDERDAEPRGLARLGLEVEDLAQRQPVDAGAADL